MTRRRASCRFMITQEKKTPLRSLPIWAKWLTDVFAASETKRKPFLPWFGGQVLAGTVGVVAVTSIVALPSKKSPLKPSGQSVHDFVNWVVHSIRRELMIPLTRPSGCAVSSEFGTVKASKTKTSLTFSVALPFFRSTLTPPLEIGAVHIF